MLKAPSRVLLTSPPRPTYRGTAGHWWLQALQGRRSVAQYPRRPECRHLFPPVSHSRQPGLRAARFQTDECGAPLLCRLARTGRNARGARAPRGAPARDCTDIAVSAVSPGVSPGPRPPDARPRILAISRALALAPRTSARRRATASGSCSAHWLRRAPHKALTLHAPCTHPARTLHAPCTHPARPPCTFHLIPCTLRPAPCTLRPTGLAAAVRPALSAALVVARARACQRGHPRRACPRDPRHALVPHGAKLEDVDGGGGGRRPRAWVGAAAHQPRGTRAAARVLDVARARGRALGGTRGGTARLGTLDAPQGFANVGGMGELARRRCRNARTRFGGGAAHA
eukprot:scaffold44194_cov40-Phaeocystis_antarctica.AAC.2